GVAALLAGAGARAQTAPAAPAAPAAVAAPAAPAAVAAPAATAATTTVSRADRQIITDLAQANMAEIEAAKLAQSKTQDEQVKTFAQQMIDDHSKALTEVQQLASAKGVTLPTELDKQHKALNDRLGAKSGAAFDQAYMAQNGLSDHKKLHAKLAAAEKKAHDPDVKALVAKMTPTVDQHMKAAQQEMASVKGNTARGGKSPAATEAGK
ncbi:MAG: DUF4142 domain-containing protein, partial [Pseudomonadota bacterium]|nr:DUF4142 domain-containing protein [Pseudomonadota bacterium]